MDITQTIYDSMVARRDEITELLLANGCSQVKWLFPEETDFCQPIVVAKK